VLNPAAGRGAAARALDPVAREFHHQGWSVEVECTEGPGHGAELTARAVQAGAQRIVAVGGDGTVHDVANGLLRCQGAGRRPRCRADRQRERFREARGRVPAQPGARGAATGHRPDGAVRRGLVCGEYFVNSVGFGFGPEVVRVRNGMPGLSGFASYFVPVLRAFARYRPLRFEVRARGFAETGYMMMMEVCNGTTAGGSYRVAPNAQRETAAWTCASCGVSRCCGSSWRCPA